MPSLDFFGYDIPLKKGGKRKKVKVSQKAAQNVTVNVKNIMRNDRTMIYPDMYKKQMDQSQNVGRQNLFSGPPIQYASPPHVIYMPHPNVGKAPVSDLIGTGTNPNPNRHRIGVDDDNISQPILTPVNPNDITQRKPSYVAVSPSRQMPSLGITSNDGGSPHISSLGINPLPLGHSVSQGVFMNPEPSQMRALPSQPAAAGLGSQIIGGVEQYAVDIPHETTPAEKRRGRPLKEAGAPKGTYNRKARSPERSPSVAAESSARDIREPTPFGQWVEK